jgi:hypothetical protein
MLWGSLFWLRFKMFLNIIGNLYAILMTTTAFLVKSRIFGGMVRVSKEGGALYIGNCCMLVVQLSGVIPVMGRLGL